MFVSDTHLPQLLPASAYHDDDWYQRERKLVFHPAWWAVALVQEMPREGHFITFDHVGGPVMVRRGGDGFHAYRNVCPHRMAKLTQRACGICPQLRCEYHGWEFDDSGMTRRIPDAPSFRPLEKGKLGLDQLRLDQAGAVLFITFDNAAPPVREWLGEEEHGRLEASIDCISRPIWREDVDLPVNWKAVVENSLESYHVGTIHAATIGASPTESDCRHELWEGGSRFTVRSPDSAWTRLKQRVGRGMGKDVSADYCHSHIHPGLLRMSIDFGGGFQSVTPTGPRSCRISYRSVVGQSGTRTLPDLIARRLAVSELPTWKKIVSEDMALLPQVQQGLESPVHPGPGLISRREERITHFQKWLLAQMNASQSAAAVPVCRPTEGAA
ncbi:MAG: hypothetical protein DWH79_00600 [Planctomycetota bacterium]|nr:MAG: hypothetical protein DWH79_00600 [Planctomycetota bacterium]